MLKTYYALAKPGIVYGNALTAAGGFLLGANGHPRLGLFVAALAGISLIIGGACAVNNYTDRGIDRHMTRTKGRGTATGSVSGAQALLFAAVLLAGGFACLILFVNWLVVALGAVAVADYLVLYAVWKRRSPFGTIVGSISGALPIVGGYCAATGRLDGGALILFLILVCWQMPHFYAIAMFRSKDYAAAGIPVLPLKKGITRTKRTIILYIVAFMAALTALTAWGYTGYVYLVAMLGLAGYWLLVGLRGLRAPDDVRWARRMFFCSLLMLPALSLLLALNPVLP